MFLIVENVTPVSYDLSQSYNVYSVAKKAI